MCRFTTTMNPDPEEEEEARKSWMKFSAVAHDHSSAGSVPFLPSPSLDQESLLRLHARSHRGLKDLFWQFQARSAYSVPPSHFSSDLPPLLSQKKEVEGKAQWNCLVAAGGGPISHVALYVIHLDEERVVFAAATRHARRCFRCPRGGGRIISRSRVDHACGIL